MKIEIPMPSNLEDRLGELITEKVTESFNIMLDRLVAPEWMKLSAGAKYAGTSSETFRKWVKQGLKVHEMPVGGVYVSKQDIDDFINKF